MYTSQKIHFKTYEDGKTPRIEGGYWWIGDTNTGVKAQATDGISFSGVEEYYYATLATAVTNGEPTKPNWQSSESGEPDGNWKTSIQDTGFGGKNSNGVTYKYLWNVECIKSITADGTEGFDYTTPDLLQTYIGGRVPKNYISYYATSDMPSYPSPAPYLSEDGNSIINNNTSWSTDEVEAIDQNTYMFEITFAEYEEKDEEGKNLYQVVSGATLIGYNGKDGVNGEGEISHYCLRTIEEAPTYPAPENAGYSWSRIRPDVSKENPYLYVVSFPVPAYEDVAKKINTHERAFLQKDWEHYGAIGWNENWTIPMGMENSHIVVGDYAYIEGVVTDKADQPVVLYGRVIDIYLPPTGDGHIRMTSVRLDFGRTSGSEVTSRTGVLCAQWTSSPYTISLSNDSATIGTDKDGGGYSDTTLYAVTKTEVTVYEGEENISGRCSYAWTTINCTVAVTDETARTAYLTGLSDNNASATVTVTYKGGPIGTKTFTISKNKQGATGAAAVTYKLSVVPNSINLTTNPDGIEPRFIVTKYTGSTIENITSGYTISRSDNQTQNTPITSKTTFTLKVDNKSVDTETVEVLNDGNDSTVPGPASIHVYHLSTTFYSSNSSSSIPAVLSGTSLNSKWQVNKPSFFGDNKYLYAAMVQRSGTDGSYTYSNAEEPQLIEVNVGGGISSEEYATFLRLTEGGTRNGITKAENGDMLFNATYINSGALSVTKSGMGGVENSNNADLLFYAGPSPTEDDKTRHIVKLGNMIIEAGKNGVEDAINEKPTVFTSVNDANSSEKKEGDLLIPSITQGGYVQGKIYRFIKAVGWEESDYTDDSAWYNAISPGDNLCSIQEIEVDTTQTTATQLSTYSLQLTTKTNSGNHSESPGVKLPKVFEVGKDYVITYKFKEDDSSAENAFLGIGGHSSYYTTKEFLMDGVPKTWTGDSQVTAPQDKKEHTVRWSVHCNGLDATDGSRLYIQINRTNVEKGLNPKVVISNIMIQEGNLPTEWKPSRRDQANLLEYESAASDGEKGMYLKVDDADEIKALSLGPITYNENVLTLGVSHTDTAAEIYYRFGIPDSSNLYVFEPGKTYVLKGAAAVSSVTNLVSLNVRTEAHDGTTWYGGIGTPVTDEEKNIISNTTGVILDSNATVDQDYSFAFPFTVEADAMGYYVSIQLYFTKNATYSGKITLKNLELLEIDGNIPANTNSNDFSWKFSPTEGMMMWNGVQGSGDTGKTNGVYNDDKLVFKVEKDGLYMRGNGVFEGEIIAHEGGEIGGWKIYNGIYGSGYDKNYTEARYVGLSTSAGDNYRRQSLIKRSETDETDDLTRPVMIYAGSKNYTDLRDAPFAVLSDGSLYASAVKLGDGNFGEDDSVFISTTDMAGTLGDSGVTSDHWRMTVGSNFGVTSDGVLYANAANITGEITATTGKIGPLTINETDNSLSYTHNNRTQLKIKGDQNYVEIYNLHASHIFNSRHSSSNAPTDYTSSTGNIYGARFSATRYKNADKGYQNFFAVRGAEQDRFWYGYNNGSGTQISSWVSLTAKNYCVRLVRNNDAWDTNNRYVTDLLFYNGVLVAVDQYKGAPNNDKSYDYVETCYTHAMKGD